MLLLIVVVFLLGGALTLSLGLHAMRRVKCDRQAHAKSVELKVLVPCTYTVAGI